ncbi:rhodanese-like domain-containing protein [Pontibacillus marinus]|uniref:Molybdopterin biosynthesis MoeB protein n=1 Tax=Pontibacillus marinus BH030004 = DSM 16465 TaxID=1385511 RepID=A0A0A5FYM0_9BACI|nr:rhodanese-like domain-containing protein [Pontibacillus marinus]KGX85911.1 molybdopterin biosynthesis MoeB protein [Pontibacillus marinus BH030004 = DSM 16465]
MKETTATEVLERLNNREELSIIDVREYGEVASGKIPSAKNIPLAELAKRKHEIDQTQEHIIVCASGNRSKAASGLLESMGFKVNNMLGGMKQWNGDAN